VVINQVLEKTDVYCDPQNVWALMMEPSIDGFFDFTRYGHEQYGKVFTTNKLNPDSKYVQSHNMTPWYTGKSYDTLLNHEVGKKEKMISCVSSNKSFLPGHKKRIDFVNKLKEADLGIDFYGRGTNPIEDKWLALYPYKFSLAIENSSSPDYWTEKLSDCLMAYTIPIYYGCTNIDKYFPPGSVLKIDINNPAHSIKVIKEAHYEKVGKGNWGSVYEKDGKIYKLTEDDTEILVSKRIFKYKGNLKHFPKIYNMKKTGKNVFDEDRYIIVKHRYTLITDVPEFMDVVNIVKKHSSNIMAHIVNQKNDLSEDVKDNDVLYGNILGIIQEFNILRLGGLVLLDFHLSNLGIDEENNIVLFDY
jgi:hypothetical protein